MRLPEPQNDDGRLIPPGNQTQPEIGMINPLGNQLQPENKGRQDTTTRHKSHRKQVESTLNTPEQVQVNSNLTKQINLHVMAKTTTKTHDMRYSK